MSKQTLSRPSGFDTDNFLKSAKGESLGYAQILEQIKSAVPFAQAMVVTSLPRGSLQSAQPQRLPEQIVHTYVKDLHAQDRLTWRAIEKGSSVRGAEAWPSGGLQNSPYFTGLMALNNFK